MWDLSSLTRHQTCVPHIARQILNHWIARGVSQFVFNFSPAAEGPQCQVMFPKVLVEDGRATLEP